MGEERDLQADLELCERATDGPWVADVEEYPGNENLRYWIKTQADES